MSTYRIEDKADVHFNGKKTSYKIFELEDGDYHCIGSGFACGWNASDSKCIADFNESLED